MMFWILAPLMVIAALGLLFVRKAVHAALCLAVVMIGLAMLYAVLDAPFLFAVQIVVSSLNIRLGGGYGPSFLGKSGPFPVLELALRIY